MELATAFVTPPGSLQSGVSHPYTNVLEGLPARKHEIRKTLSSGVERNAGTEVLDHGKPNRPLELARLQNSQCKSLLVEENRDRLPPILRRRGNDLRLIDP